MKNMKAEIRSEGTIFDPAQSASSDGMVIGDADANEIRNLDYEIKSANQ
jgi:hypothetical protein